MTTTSLGKILLSDRVVPPEGLAAALRQQVVYGGRLGTNLLELGTIQHDALARALAAQHGVPAALTRHLRNADKRARVLVPASLCSELVVMPLAFARAGGRRLVVCMRDPTNTDTLEQLKQVCKLEIINAACPELTLYRLLQHYFAVPLPPRMLRNTAMPATPLPTGPDASAALVAEEMTEPHGKAPTASRTPTLSLVDLDHEGVERDETQLSNSQTALSLGDLAAKLRRKRASEPPLNPAIALEPTGPAAIEIDKPLAPTGVMLDAQASAQASAHEPPAPMFELNADEPPAPMFELDADKPPAQVIELDAGEPPTPVIELDADEPPAPAIELDAEPAISAIELDAEPAISAIELDAEPAMSAIELDAEPAMSAIELDADEPPAPAQGGVARLRSRPPVAARRRRPASPPIQVGPAGRASAAPAPVALAPRGRATGPVPLAKARGSSVTLEPVIRPTQQPIVSTDKPPLAIDDNATDPAEQFDEAPTNVKTAPGRRKRRAASTLTEALTLAAATNREKAIRETLERPVPAGPPPMGIAQALAEIARAGERTGVANAIIGFLKTHFDAGVILSVRDEVAYGHRGFGGHFDAESVESIVVPLADVSPFRQAFTSKRSYLGAGGGDEDSLFGRFLLLFPIKARPEIIAVEPVELHEQIVCLIYAHSEPASEPPDGAFDDLALIARATSAAFTRLIREQRAN